MDKEQALEKLSKVYDTGAVLFYEGDPANAVWIINGGKVQLSKRVCSEEIVIETLGAGDFFGEISLLSNSAQMVTATVVEPAKLLVIESPQYEALLRSNGELSMRMLRKLVGRLNECQFLVTGLSLRNPMARVMLHIRREINALGARSVQLPDDLGKMLAIDPVELELILKKLETKALISIDETKKVSIVRGEEFDRFLQYLELHDRYESFER